jgi:hypothetical protein
VCPKSPAGICWFQQGSGPAIARLRLRVDASLYAGTDKHCGRLDFLSSVAQVCRPKNIYRNGRTKRLKYFWIAEHFGKPPCPASEPGRDIDYGPDCATSE